MLQTSGFISYNSFDFGSRSRDFGYIPTTGEEIQSWYETAISSCVNLAISDDRRLIEARALLARQWCPLWLNVRLYDLIETFTRDLQIYQPWADGWLAIRRTIRFHSNDLTPETKARLEKLVSDLAPADLVENVCLYVCKETHDPRDLDQQVTGDDEITEETFSQAYIRLDAMAHDLGVAVGEDNDLIDQLLPALVNSRSPRIKPFCKGLASRIAEMSYLLECCCTVWKQTDPYTRTLDMLIGSLEQYSVSDRTSYELFLDRLMADADFSIVFPCIQLGLDIDHQAVERLIACINLRTAPLGSYRNLGHASVVSRIDRDRLLLLLARLRDVEHGDLVILDSLSLLVSLSGSDQLPISYLDFAREVLARQDFSRSIVRPNSDYDLERIAKASLSGEQGAEAARIVSANLLAGILNYSVTGYGDHPRLMDALATCQPTIFLDVFLGSQFDHQGMIGRIFDSASWHDNLSYRYNALGLIENDCLLGWCETDPDHRFSALAEAVQLCTSSPNETGRPDLSWSPLALELLSRAPSTDNILKAFGSVFFPCSWTGSRADMIAERLPLLDSLEQHSNPAVASWACIKRAELTRYVADLRVKEEQDYGVMSQRFE